MKQIKRTLITIISINILAYTLAHAEGLSPRVPDVRPMNNEEASATNILLGKLLNSIEKASLDFETAGSFDSDGGFLSEKITLTGLLKFNSDWSIRLEELQKNSHSNASSESDSSQMSKIMPVLGFNSKFLVASVVVRQDDKVTRVRLDFYQKYDQKRKSWSPRPLTLTVNNKLNSALLKLNFNWVEVEIVQPTTPGQASTVKGTCSSDKLVLDLRSGFNHRVPARCEFQGTFSDSGYKIDYKYVNYDEVSSAKP